ncbi:MAG: sulfite exporter TauE/SafE family protein [Candidatus Fermentibacteraceae bacterium]|nr:sulfite exporter TauE/SafE family protein [Candidatus Fermentibacteraceae bacterium]
MVHVVLTGVLVFAVAVFMTMVGKGGGNFYVVILALTGFSMFEAAATGQFILLAASIAAMVIFQKSRHISWTLAVVIGLFVSVAALCGGYYSHQFKADTLKLLFAGMLVVAGVIMLLPVPAGAGVSTKKNFGYFTIKYENAVYTVNLWIAVPVAVVTGFAAGMVGVSGGSFLVPLMVLACGVPMHVAVGTASVLIAATAMMGFTGHAIQGDFNLMRAIPLAVLTTAGGVLGGRYALKTKPANLKKVFAWTNWLAALFMVASVMSSKGII